MEIQTIGVLHPGDMGSSVAHSARKLGHRVLWLPKGRSDATAERARQADLEVVESLESMTACCDLIISVCPPACAESVATEVRQAAPEDRPLMFLDANAISPRRTAAMADTFTDTAITYLDGGLVGPPAWKPETTRLYLSGTGAQQVANWFQGGLLEPKYLDEDIGSASAMKMCFAAWTKGSTALIASILCAASHYGVEDALESEWGEETTQARVANIRRIAARAWRWEAEMLEIADSLSDAGVPGDYHRAAAEIYRRMAGFRGAPDRPHWNDIRAALLEGD